MSAIAPAPRVTDGELMERAVIIGDLSKLTPNERVAFYRRVCESLGLNPLTQPFSYIVLNNKLTLYAKRDATDQLRRLHGISVQIVSREQVGDLFVVVARATSKDGRADESIGAVPTVGLKGEALANAMMKAETKAKRRVTLSIAGLGWMDEAETGSVPGASVAHIDTETGEITGEAPGAARVTSEAPVGPAPIEPSTPSAPASDRIERTRALGRLNLAVDGSGLDRIALREKAQALFSKSKVDDMTVDELDGLSAEVEALKQSTVPS